MSIIRLVFSRKFWLFMTKLVILVGSLESGVNPKKKRPPVRSRRARDRRKKR